MNYGFSLFSLEPKLRDPVEFVLSEHRRNLISFCPSRCSAFAVFPVSGIVFLVPRPLTHYLDGVFYCQVDVC